jgi:hypothetical protein
MSQEINARIPRAPIGQVRKNVGDQPTRMRKQAIFNFPSNPFMVEWVHLNARTCRPTLCSKDSKECFDNAATM